MANKLSESDKLLNRLSKLKLKQYKATDFKEYMISDDDPSWKRPKKDTEVYGFYVAIYEKLKNRIICRTFYISQRWLHKEKVTDIFEVKRQLSGCSYQLTRRLYASMGGGIKCWTYDYSYPFDYRNNNEWQIHKIGTFDVSTEGSMYYGQRWKRSNYFIHTSAGELASLLENSVYKYSGFEYSVYSIDELFEYLSIYDKHPEVEMISKIGLSYLLKDDLRVLRWSKKGTEILGIKKCDIERLKKLHIPLKEFKKYRDLIYKFKIEDRSDFNELLKLIEISKIKYADINISVYAFDYFKMQGTSLYIIKDYYKFCEELGLPMNHSNRYPDNIGEAHDRLMIQIETKKSAKDDLMIRERVSNELSKYRFADDDFVITPANSIADLINESAKLNHCVRTYDKRYASGETSIFLIRKRDDVNSPFYTLELSSKNEIKQLRGKNNCTAVNEVLDFVEGWRRKFNLKSSILKQNEDA